MPDEANKHPGRGRGRKRLEEGPPILIDAWERRVVKTKRGKIRIEHYAVVNARTLEEVIGRMSQPENRRAIDLEQANPLRRRKLLLRMTHVRALLSVRKSSMRFAARCRRSYRVKVERIPSRR